MKSYECDPAVTSMILKQATGNGIAPGTPFENLPEDWVCRSVVWAKKYLK